MLAVTTTAALPHHRITHHRITHLRLVASAEIGDRALGDPAFGDRALGDNDAQRYQYSPIDHSIKSTMLDIERTARELHGQRATLDALYANTHNVALTRQSLRRQPSSTRHQHANQTNRLNQQPNNRPSIQYHRVTRRNTLEHIGTRLRYRLHYSVNEACIYLSSDIPKAA